MSADRIPIENIYFLLCYAWNHAQEKQYADLRSKSCSHVWDLLAKVLVRSTQQLIKRGVHRDYVLVRERRMRIKGKVLFAEEARHRVFGSPARVCEFDELSADVLPNRIIRATVERLRRHPDLSSENRRELREVSGLFSEFATLRLESRHFRQVQLHRNMRHYRFVLSVCQFVHTESVATEASGSSRFRDFERDEATMGPLFEQFVRNFYRFEQDAYSVSAPQIDWAIDRSRCTEGALQLMPTMRTDICLDSVSDKLVVDCKFYAEAFQRNFNKASFISANLYQLFAYLKNKEFEPGWESARGMLLYPVGDHRFDEVVHVHGHSIRLVALNLNQNWEQIATDLHALLPPPAASQSAASLV